MPELMQTARIQYPLPDGDYFVAVLDPRSGIIVTSGWTTNPEGWQRHVGDVTVLVYQRILSAHYVNPETAAKRARAAVSPTESVLHDQREGDFSTTPTVPPVLARLHR